jgi:hypothetical protein
MAQAHSNHDDGLQCGRLAPDCDGKLEVDFCEEVTSQLTAASSLTAVYRGGHNPIHERYGPRDNCNDPEMGLSFDE